MLVPPHVNCRNAQVLNMSPKLPVVCFQLEQPRLKLHF